MNEIKEILTRPSASYGWLHTIVNDPTGLKQTEALASFKVQHRFASQAVASKAEYIGWLKAIAADNIWWFKRGQEDVILQAIIKFETGVRKAHAWVKKDAPLSRVVQTLLTIIYILLTIWSVMSIWRLL